MKTTIQTIVAGRASGVRASDQSLEPIPPHTRVGDVLTETQRRSSEIENEFPRRDGDLTSSSRYAMLKRCVLQAVFQDALCLCLFN